MDLDRTGRIGLVIVLTPVLIVAVFSLEGSHGEWDFLAYWSATRLLVTAQNPYDPESLRSLVVETRPSRNPLEGEPFAAWNPPWLLTVLLPFGLLPFDHAVRVWIICNLGLIATAAAVTGKLLDQHANKRGVLIAVMAGLWSAQTLMTVLLGQTSSLVLAGLVLGTWWLRSGRDMLAGAAFFLTAIKPHMTYLVLLVLLLWVLRCRRWRVMHGAIAAGVISMVTLCAFFPRWLLAYYRLLIAYRSFLFQYTTSTIGSLAYAVWDVPVFRFAGVLLLPLVPLLVRLADSEDWLTAMNVALLMSLPLAVYGFGADLVVLIPAIVQILSWLWRGELPPPWARLIGGGLAAVHIASFAMLVVSWRHSYWFTLIPLAWAGLYAVAWRLRVVAQRSGTANPGQNAPKVA